MKQFLLLMLGRFHTLMVMHQGKVPAAEQVIVLILLAPDRKLIRDHRGCWNHASLLTQVKDIKNGGTVPWFNGGYKGRTIEKLIEAGRLRATKFDVSARPTEVVWVPL